MFWMLRKCVLKEDFELFSANTNLELYVWIIRKCLLKENSEPLVANANVALNVLLNWMEFKFNGYELRICV